MLVRRLAVALVGTDHATPHHYAGSTMQRIVPVVIALAASIVLAGCGNGANSNEGESAADGKDHNAADVTFARR